MQDNIHIKSFLNYLDEYSNDFLRKFKNIMPKKFGKFIALYYTDAVIRKEYSDFIGLEMGENTFANLGLKVVPNENKICVHIGNNVSIAPNVTFVCKSCANNGNEINEIDYVKNVLTKAEDIYVEDDVWIGANATILPGVRIGKCSIIGACSLIIDNVEPYSVYAGVPAKKIRELKVEI